MLDQDVTAIVGLCILAALSVVAAWYDLRERRIPNWITALTAIAGLSFATVHSPTWSAAGSHALHMLAALAICMVLFRLGVFGGGDAKFYAAVGSWFALGDGILLMLNVVLAGLVLLVAWFIVRRWRGIPIRRPVATRGSSLPYGIAIGCGAIATMLIGRG